MNSITISNLRKVYGPIAAVDGFSLEIPGATVFGLLGPNGAGKTTTFKCMLGLARATSGTILYDGRPLAPATFERIAYVPERSVLYEWMTVEEHVEMNRRAFTAFNPARAFELLGEFNVDRRRRARALSKGMRTAVMVALAFAQNAEILVLDEPTAGLDPVNQRHVLTLMINEAAKGNAVIFSSHQIGQVERAAEQIAIMDRGRLLLQGLVDDLKGDRKIVEGIFPDVRFTLDGIANDPRVARVDRTERIVRLLVTGGADEIASRLSGAGALGVRVLDLNLEDIFLYAVSPATATTDIVAEGSSS
jgi:ABC-2 type transport system ATP-binding protein